MTKWIGTGLCLIGIALTSLNIYPLNLLFGLIGSFLWTVEGLVAKDYALFTVEAVAVGMYLGGIIRVFT
jgi:drug/metabolite transporter (DMT)-like permease